MRKILKMAGAVMAAFALTLAAGVAVEMVQIQRAEAHDLAHPDYIYLPPLGTPVGTNTNFMTVMFYQIALAILQGDYHGLAQQTSVPPAPATGMNLTVLKGVGLAAELTDGGLITPMMGITTVVDYPDGGFVPAGSQQNTIQTGLGVLAAGTATITFAQPFQDGGVPICTCSLAQADGGANVVNCHAPATNASLVVTGTNVDHFTYSCVGPMAYGF